MSPHHNTGIAQLFNIEGNTFTSTVRTLPCLSYHNTGITLLFNIEGNTFTSTGRTLPVSPSPQHRDYPTLLKKCVNYFKSHCPKIASQETSSVTYNLQTDKLGKSAREF